MSLCKSPTNCESFERLGKRLTFNFTYRSSVSSSSMELCVMSLDAFRSEISSYENNTNENVKFKRSATSGEIETMFWCEGKTNLRLAGSREDMLRVTLVFCRGFKGVAFVFDSETNLLSQFQPLLIRFRWLVNFDELSLVMVGCGCYTVTVMFCLVGTWWVRFGGCVHLSRSWENVCLFIWFWWN